MTSKRLSPILGRCEQQIICFLECIISQLATDEFSIFYLVSVAEDWFESRFIGTPKTVLPLHNSFILIVNFKDFSIFQ